MMEERTTTNNNQQPTTANNWYRGKTVNKKNGNRRRVFEILRIFVATKVVDPTVLHLHAGTDAQRYQWPCLRGAQRTWRQDGHHWGRWKEINRHEKEGEGCCCWFLSYSTKKYAEITLWFQYDVNMFQYFLLSWIRIGSSRLHVWYHLFYSLFENGERKR